MVGPRWHARVALAVLFGLSLLIVGCSSSDEGEIVAQELTATEVDGETTSEGSTTANDTTDPVGVAEETAQPDDVDTTPQSVLVVLSEVGSSEESTDEDSTEPDSEDDTPGDGDDEDSAETTTSTTATTLTAKTEETTPSTAAPTTKAVPTTKATSTTAKPATTERTTTTAAPTTAKPPTTKRTTTTKPPTTAAPTTTTSTTTTRPTTANNFPNDEVVMVSSGAETTFSAQLAPGGSPVVVWFWLPG